MPIGKKTLSVYVILASLLVLTVVACVSLGAVSVPFDDVFRVIAGKLLWLDAEAGIEKSHELIVWNVRLPRVLLAATIGGGLSIVGAVMQAMFRNPLAEPGILGWSSGGAFFAVLAIYTGIYQRWFLLLPLVAFAGTLLTAYAVYGISRYRGFVENTTLLLCGVALGTLFVSLTTFVLSVSNAWSHEGNAFLDNGRSRLAHMDSFRDGRSSSARRLGHTAFLREEPERKTPWLRNGQDPRR